MLKSEHLRAMLVIRKTFLPGLCAAALLAGTLSCSVKEDRDGCPVYVTVVTDGFLREGLDAGTLSFDSKELQKQDDINFRSLAGRGYVQALSREYARVGVVSGAEHERFTESGLYTPYGLQAGLIWAYGESFSRNADEYVVDAEPHKQYCLVQFLFDGSSRAPEGYDWRFRIKAECNGLDIYTMEPQEGPYCCAVGPNAVGEWFGVIPRQKRSNMILEVFTPNSDSEIEGPTEYVIDLGKQFEEKGYDWTRKDLSDISVKVGFSSAGVRIEVEDWIGDDRYSDVEI